MPTTLEQEYSPISSSSRLSYVSPYAFWILGVLNNTSYVLLLACAKSISEGGTALVFLSNAVPSLVVKLTAPYWFDRVSYQIRLLSSALLMALSFIIVAAYNGVKGRTAITMELIGVAFASAQCGLGEASLLAYAGKCDIGRSRGACLTAFSSGTGVAGIFGFLWKFIFNDWLNFSIKMTLYSALSLAASYAFVYWRFLRIHQEENSIQQINSNDDNNEEEEETTEESRIFHDESDEASSTENNSAVIAIKSLTATERFRKVLSLWPYMIPLYVVYAAEYSLQAGTWTAIGFPMEDEKARAKFYEYSNWLYQVGVFLSRSSGTIYTAPMSILWLMPTLQVINVMFFWGVAKYQFWYNNYLLIPAFYVGLLGGAVYVNGYTRICADIPIEEREFALSSVSTAEGLGIVTADALGLFLQACLYKIHNINGALVSCPISNP